jgi:hypothetical protein
MVPGTLPVNRGSSPTTPHCSPAWPSCDATLIHGDIFLASIDLLPDRVVMLDWSWQRWPTSLRVNDVPDELVRIAATRDN